MLHKLLPPSEKVKTKHREIEIIIRGQSVAVDKGIHDLIVLVNSLPGLETFNSCQGDPKHKAYVHFGGEGAIDLLPVLASEIFGELYRNHSTSICLDVNYTGIALRWYPRDYERVLRIFGMLAMMAAEQNSRRRPFLMALITTDKFNPPKWKKVPITKRRNCKSV